MTIRQTYSTDKEYMWHYCSRFQSGYANNNITGEALSFVYDWKKYGKWVQGINSKQIELFYTWVSSYQFESPLSIEKLRVGLNSHILSAELSFRELVAKQVYPTQFDYHVYMINILMPILGKLWEELVIESGKLNKTWC